MSLISAYKPLPIAFEKGEGVWLFDSQGNQYLDTASGIGVNSLGHSHPQLINAICEQSKQLMHTSNMYEITNQTALAEKLTKLTGMSQVFFGNSGAEANEAALKLARLYGHKKNITNPHVIVTEGAFHGRTLATLSASGSRKVQAGFEPLVSGFVRAPYDDVAALEKIAQQNQDIVAILVEPIQGESGINIPSVDYLKEIHALCKKHDWLFMLDEIQTGMGRTGHWFCFQGQGVTPDVLTSAKALGNGMPIGACLMQDKALDLFQPGNHGSTFGGNPLACKTALTVIDIMEKSDIVQNAKQMGEILKASLIDALSSHPNVVDIRGEGMMFAIEMTDSCRPILKKGLENGILFNVTADKVIRLLPPLIFTKEHVDECVVKLTKTVSEYFKS